MISLYVSSKYLAKARWAVFVTHYRDNCPVSHGACGMMAFTAGCSVDIIIIIIIIIILHTGIWY